MQVKDLFVTRDVTALLEETHGQGEELKRSIGAFGLTALGVGAIIGTGIFVVIGKGAAIAGPALVISFVLAAVTCTFSALSYAELSSAVPISGSAYTFSYATLGELVAFIIGWDLILEYGVSVAGVAVGWGGNVNEFLLAAFGFELPTAISKSPSEGGVFNIPAVFIVALITVLLTLGTRESATVNAVMVVIKLAILIFFIIVAFTAFIAATSCPLRPRESEASRPRPV
jgi:APA family basic amino acid/polyamine antiporter